MPQPKKSWSLSGSTVASVDAIPRCTIRRNVKKYAYIMHAYIVMYVCLHTYMYICMHIVAYAYTCMVMCTCTYMHKCLHIHMKGGGNTPIKCRGLQMTGFPESESPGPHWIPKWIYLKPWESVGFPNMFRHAHAFLHFC